MKFIDLFAGIGGFRYGMEQAGHKCVGFCEFDKYAQMSYTAMHCATEEQRQYLASLPMKDRQKEILKEEYRNGEWFINDIRAVNAGNVPKADCWTFGAPCQDFSVAGKRAGLAGDRSVLVREVFRAIGEIPEEDRPEWLIYENVKGMLSSNAGRDYLEILMALDDLGYDIEWQLFNSKNHGVPQNRERVYTIGHLRRRGSAHVFPITGTDGEDNAKVIQIGRRPRKNRDNPNRFRIYSPAGIAPTLGTMQGGGLEPHIVAKIAMPALTQDRQGVAIEISGHEVRPGESVARCLNTTDQRKVFGWLQTRTMVATSAEADGQQPPAVWYPKAKSWISIRRLTPHECFKLQGWPDEYFDRAAMVNSNTQLYKQAGNGVTTTVVYAITKRMNTAEDREKDSGTI